MSAFFVFITQPFELQKFDSYYTKKRFTKHKYVLLFTRLDS
jgi:hypothetical protein